MSIMFPVYLPIFCYYSSHFIAVFNFKLDTSPGPRSVAQAPGACEKWTHCLPGTSWMRPCCCWEKAGCTYLFI